MSTKTAADLTLDLSVAPSVSSRRWEAATLTWERLVDRAHNPESVKDCGGYVAGRLKGTARRKGRVEYRSAVTLDADAASETLPAVVAGLGLRALVHSTYSHTRAHPRYRVIFPIMGPGLSEEEYPRVARGLIEALGEAQFDPGSTQPERLMFWPATANPDEYEVVECQGETATAQSLLRDFGGLQATPDHKTGPKRDPKELSGVAGAFNRVYDMARAVETFHLPYDPVDGEPNRWHYTPAESEGGVIVYPDGYVFSNHASDPAYGRALSMFDLVALHVYGGEDRAAGVPQSTAPADRPSIQRAMREFAARPEIVTELVAADFADVDGDEDGARGLPEWVLEFHLHPKTGKPLDDVHNWDLLMRHDPVLRALARNEMDLTTVTRHPFPWRTVEVGKDDALTNADRAQISAHLQRAYNMPRPAQEQLNGVIDMVAQDNAFHPVREYLESLEWDGVSRIETYLPGAPDAYTRRVARLVAVQAVARALDPGVKVDNCLILTGRQGLGKSWFVETMARGWTCTLGPIEGSGLRDTVMAMTRSWITVADEGFAMKKADAEALKQFVTLTHDVIRLPYAREHVKLPRRQVIWGTTNDAVFLRAQEGNRRFLIVEVAEKLDFGKYTDEYVNQVWAEAVHIWKTSRDKYGLKDNPELFLSSEEEAAAESVRSMATEEDSVGGLIQAYLDTLVPANWADMSPDERISWLRDEEQGIVSGTHPIDVVCSLEIWEIALGRERGKHSRVDILQITNALKQLPGWFGPMPKPTRLPFYGPQRVFARLDEPTDVSDSPESLI
jgi:virulence-associated E family protein|uniref:Virulence associated protein E n=2 Tax=unclassified Caudoviricetes TaxID=2788787 RepID=A0A8S5QSV0_9CAUD|nr:MAG TPA: virulence associated protein E [Siphoviridae sp. ctf4O12]DAE24448.1 MAG TPA: virulence associated protein E [Siphoviridae sp. ctbOs39]